MIPFVIKRKKYIYKCCVYIGHFQKQIQELVKTAYLCGNVIGHLWWGEERSFRVL